ncbi:MAG: DUF3276 family protein [Chitinophagales bacterium]|nr:PUR family DNA/RNA-binding protein [Chitinophagales bacterium]MDW8273451.1 DUF3276 family protein [Chitinophagales bacterium]
MFDDKLIVSEKVPAGRRTYFLDLKETRQGDKLLKITESKKDNGDFIRHSILIYEEDFDKIFEALEKVKGHIKD